MITSCATKERGNESYILSPQETYLSFPIDEDTRLPKFILWSFKDHEKEYIAFDNHGDEILFYNIQTQSLVKKVRFDLEGVNGIVTLNSFYVKDFNHIYIPSPQGGIYVTDTTAVIRQHIRFSDFKEKHPLIRFFSLTLNHSPICFIGENLYIPQPINPLLGGDFLPHSPVGALLDTVSKGLKVAPLTYLPYVPTSNIPSYVRGTIISHCYDGERLIYSFDTEDSLFTLSSDFSIKKSYIAKSKYVDKVKVNPIKEQDLSIALKTNCETAGYGNIIYDKYKEVYYRFVYPEVELDNAETDYMDILHWGGKKFSIIILDKNLNVVGETMFPEYTYNSRLFFISEDGLYLSATHFKRPDFDENVLRFQKMELMKLL